MKTKQLITLLRNGILNDRSNNTGGSSDHLWSDETLATYINEAYFRMATEGLMLRDAATPEVTQFALVAGQRDYPLHQAVVAVLSARVQTAQFDLTRTDHNALSGGRRMTDGLWDGAASTPLQPGQILAFTTDEGLSDTASNAFEQITFRAFPPPGLAQDGEIIQLRVIRKPLDEIDCEQPEYEPELPREWHIRMLDWAAYLALRIVDDDMGAPARAAEFANAFEANVDKSRRQVLSKLQQGQGWGFGRGGFSWETGNYGG